jgi:hypothetical protein
VADGRTLVPVNTELDLLHPVGAGTTGSALDRRARDLAERAAAGRLHAWDHTAFVLVAAELVRRHGVVGARRRLRGVTARLGVPATGRGARDGHHETLVVFYVWAVARLLSAGLDLRRVLWHPLTGARAPLAWYEVDTLRRPDARAFFVSPDRALPGDPSPSSLGTAA